MRIVAQKPDSYQLECDCGKRFNAARPSMTVECPSCHDIQATSELVTSWVVRSRKSIALMDRESQHLVG